MPIPHEGSWKPGNPVIVSRKHPKKLLVRESNPGRLRDRQKCYQLHQRGLAVLALARLGIKMSSGGRFRSSDLWVMSPTRFRCATPLLSDVSGQGRLEILLSGPRARLRGIGKSFQLAKLWHQYNTSRAHKLPPVQERLSYSGPCKPLGWSSSLIGSLQTKMQNIHHLRFPRGPPP